MRPRGGGGNNRGRRRTFSAGTTPDVAGRTRVPLHLVPRIVAVSDDEPVPRRVHVGLVPGAVAARQPQERHPEVGADERVDERVDGRVYPTCGQRKRARDGPETAFGLVPCFRRRSLRDPFVSRRINGEKRRIS